MAVRQIYETTNYAIFARGTENRQVTLQERGKLLDSMKRQGYLWVYPAVCFREPDGRLLVKDGQNRVEIARQLGLPVSYVVTDVDFDPAEVNEATKPWSMRDYAQRWMASGKDGYREGLEFADTHELPVGMAFAVLGGTVCINNIARQFKNGNFEVKDRDFAWSAGELYAELVELAPRLKGALFLQAVVAVCRARGFDRERLVKSARRTPGRLTKCASRKDYLVMLENVYNSGAREPVGLMALATSAMRQRNAATKKAAATPERMPF